MISRKLCLLEAVGAAATQSTPSVGIDHHQEAYMPGKGIFQRDAVLQTLSVDSPLLNMAATWEPESRKQTP